MGRISLRVALLLLVAADGYSVFVVVYAIFVRKGPQTNTFWLAIALIVAVTLGLLRVTIRVGRRVRASFANRFAKPS